LKLWYDLRHQFLGESIPDNYSPMTEAKYPNG
jgi:hypothetical protein